MEPIVLRTAQQALDEAGDRGERFRAPMRMTPSANFTPPRPMPEAKQDGNSLAFEMRSTMRRRKYA